MPDRIDQFRALNRLVPPGQFGAELQRITRPYVDGDAYRKVARRAPVVETTARFFVADAAGVPNLLKALGNLRGKAGLAMEVDGQSYSEIICLNVVVTGIQPLQGHSKTIDYTGADVPGGAGGRIVSAAFLIGRSNVEDEET